MVRWRSKGTGRLFDPEEAVRMPSLMKTRRILLMAEILLLVLLTTFGCKGICMADEARAGLRQKKQEAQTFRTRLEQQQIWGAFAVEMRKGLDLMGRITDDTPWYVRVNQGTNTVTVYRVLQVSQKEIPFSEGFQTIVAAAVKKADRLAERAGEGSAADTGLWSSNGQEKPVRGYFRHIVLRQFRQTDASPAPTTAVYIPVFACPCSVGANNGTPDGMYTLQDHLRWHELVGPTWGQWCCHFAPSLLFHSLPYDRPNDPNSLQEGVYNQIGTSASHGCVRLVAVDAKYIYDHIPSGTKIEIFTGSARQDPLGTPERPFIGEWSGTYDPTDPEFKPE